MGVYCRARLQDFKACCVRRNKYTNR
uniref:Uncharacterized protein n=1 Tax=Anguilla anguilla TaxID=7936 RepID=A0A0E9T2K3_ANGAN